MTAELLLVRRCEEHGEVDEHCLHADGLVKRGDEACSEGYCPGGSVVVLDPERLVRDVWIVDEGDTEVVVRQAHVTVASFLDALAQERT